MKLAGRWVLYRAIDSTARSSTSSPRRSGPGGNPPVFARAWNAARRPTKVTTTGAPAYPRPRRARARGVARGEAVCQQPHRSDHGHLKARHPSDAPLETSAAPRWPVGARVRSEPAPPGHYDSDTTLNPAAGLRRSSPNLPSPSEPCLHPRSLLPPPQRNGADGGPCVREGEIRLASEGEAAPRTRPLSAQSRTASFRTASRGYLMLRAGSDCRLGGVTASKRTGLIS